MKRKTLKLSSQGVNFPSSVKMTSNAPSSPPPSLLSQTISTTIQTCPNRWQQHVSLIAAGVLLFFPFFLPHLTCTLAGEQLPAASHRLSLAVAGTKVMRFTEEAPCYLQNSKAGSTYNAPPPFSDRTNMKEFSNCTLAIH